MMNDFELRMDSIGFDVQDVGDILRGQGNDLTNTEVLARRLELAAEAIRRASAEQLARNNHGS